MKKQGLVRNAMRWALGVMACVAMATGVAMAETIDVMAANFAQNRTLQNGNTYRFVEDVTFTAPAGAAGLRGGEGTLTIGANAQVLAERGYYSVGRIPENGEDVVYDNGKLFRVSNWGATEIAYTVVTKDTGWLDVGKWYVVKGIVNRSDTLSVHEGQAANLVIRELKS